MHQCVLSHACSHLLITAWFRLTVTTQWHCCNYYLPKHQPVGKLYFCRDIFFEKYKIYGWESFLFRDKIDIFWVPMVFFVENLQLFIIKLQPPVSPNLFSQSVTSLLLCERLWTIGLFSSTWRVALYLQISVSGFWYQFFMYLVWSWSQFSYFGFIYWSHQPSYCCSSLLFSLCWFRHIGWLYIATLSTCCYVPVLCTANTMTNCTADNVETFLYLRTCISSFPNVSH